MLEFFAMGGYAGYVWSSFGLTLFVLVLNLWSAQRRHRMVQAQIRRQLDADGDTPQASFKEVMT